MKNKYPWVGSIVGLVLVLDQFTKYLVEKSIRMYDVIPVLPGFFNLTHVRNKGAAFSLFSTMPGWFRSAFFITVTLVAVAALAVLIRKTGERLLVVAFSLIAGGAVGNVIDRMRFGEVVDFIQWYYRSFYWPSFNVADSAISIGVGLLVIDMIFKKPQVGESSKS
jgi:signal peptidase II